MTDRYLRPDVLAKPEIQQAQSVGHDCSELLAKLAKLPSDGLTDQQCGEAERIYNDALALGYPAGYRYLEPSTLTEIRRERPSPSDLHGHDLPEEALRDRIGGGWVGRAAGCLLGKPVEGWSRRRIRDVLQTVNAYPLDDYFPEIPADEDSGFHGTVKSWTRGNIDRAPRDDDTDYTILGLTLLEQHGAQFTTEQVGNAWLELLPFRKTYTAERMAYHNLVNGLGPPKTAVHLNPYREWIGAQIRADAFGYCSPGLPETAAELAFRDAALSHVANGIYGEMWVAAMLAGAFVCDDVQQVIEIGLGEIPRHCRLAEAVRNTITWCRNEANWESVRDKIEAEYGSLHPVHTINNACLVTLGLMKSDGNFERGIGIAVMGGWDTDCNGATAGSVLGVMTGAQKLPPKWTDPLNDTLESAIFGFATNSIAALAERTLAVSRTVAAVFGQ